MVVHIVFSLLLAKVKVSQRRITSLTKGRFSSACCRDSSSACPIKDLQSAGVKSSVRCSSDGTSAMKVQRTELDAGRLTKWIPSEQDWGRPE